MNGMKETDRTSWAGIAPGATGTPSTAPKGASLLWGAPQPTFATWGSAVPSPAPFRDSIDRFAPIPPTRNVSPQNGWVGGRDSVELPSARPPLPGGGGCVAPGGGRVGSGEHGALGGRVGSGERGAPRGRPGRYGIPAPLGEASALVTCSPTAAQDLSPTVAASRAGGHPPWLGGPGSASRAGAVEGSDEEVHSSCAPRARATSTTAAALEALFADPAYAALLRERGASPEAVRRERRRQSALRTLRRDDPESFAAICAAQASRRGVASIESAEPRRVRSALETLLGAVAAVAAAVLLLAALRGDANAEGVWAGVDAPAVDLEASTPERVLGAITRSRDGATICANEWNEKAAIQEDPGRNGAVAETAEITNVPRAEVASLREPVRSPTEGAGLEGDASTKAAEEAGAVEDSGVPIVAEGHAALDLDAEGEDRSQAHDGAFDSSPTSVRYAPAPFLALEPLVALVRSAVDGAVAQLGSVGAAIAGLEAAKLEVDALQASLGRLFEGGFTIKPQGADEKGAVPGTDGRAKDAAEGVSRRVETAAEGVSGRVETAAEDASSSVETATEGISTPSESSAKGASILADSSTERIGGSSAAASSLGDESTVPVVDVTVPNASKASESSPPSSGALGGTALLLLLSAMIFFAGPLSGLPLAGGLTDLYYENVRLGIPADAARSISAAVADAALALATWGFAPAALAALRLTLRPGARSVGERIAGVRLAQEVAQPAAVW